ncbi:hypothetical protein JCM3774_006350 [Rhodotorula dairenensis]
MAARASGATATATSPRLLEPPRPGPYPAPPSDALPYAAVHTYARSDPYLAAGRSSRRHSGPDAAPLVPFDQAVRLERERTVRASSTTALPSWPESHHPATYPAHGDADLPSPTVPFQSQPRGVSIPSSSDRTPLQRTPTRKLTKYRRTSPSGAPSRTSAPSSPTAITYIPPQLSPTRSEQWAPHPLHVAPAPHFAGSPYPPVDSPPHPYSSYSSPQLPSPHSSSWSQTQPAPWCSHQSFPQSAGASQGGGNFQHLSPYPPVRPPLPSLLGRTESEEQQMERARRESLEAEQARVAALAAAEDELLYLTLAESESAAARERTRLEALELRSMQDVIRASREQEEGRRWEEERRRAAEEEAVARAIEASRAAQDGAPSGKGKGKARMPSYGPGFTAGAAQDPREDEALELAVRLSLDEAARQHRWQQQQQQQYSDFASASQPAALRDFGVAETSAQAFERYSRPAEPSFAGPAAGPSVLARPRRGMSLLDDEYGVPLDVAVADPATLPPPPAYELPPHAAELDQPGDVIVGPGRPLPPAPFPTPARRPLPTPPIRVNAIDPLPEVGGPSEDVRASDWPFRPAAVTTTWQPTNTRAQLEPTLLTPAHSEVDPFGDEHEVRELAWETAQSRSGTPASPVTDSAASDTSPLAPPDAGAALQSNSIQVPVAGQPRIEEAYGRVDSKAVKGLTGRPLPISAAASSPSSSPPSSSAPVSPVRVFESLTLSGESPLAADPAPTSPNSLVRGSVPSFGGYVEEGSSLPASERILREVKWDFVHLDLSKSGRRPPLAYEGDFPRGAQLSLVADPDGHQAYVSFAVEARTWQGLLVYLMWHGNSRFEAAPSDLERDKSGHGYRASVSLDFYRAPSTSNTAVSIRPPRVRARVTLLPLLDRPPQHPDAAGSPFAISVVSTPSFDAVNPNIRLELTVPPTLPIALSSLASLLADAHAAAREVTSQARPAASRHGKAAAAPPPPPATAGQQALVSAVELFRKLGGEDIRSVHGHHDAHDDERSLLDRMKARLRRRRGPQLVPVLNDDPSEGLPLPEGALLITPFPLDSA